MILISGGSSQIGQGIINKFLTKELNFYFLERKKKSEKKQHFFLYR